MAVRIQRTPSSSGSNSKFTFSAWVKRGTLGALSPMFSAGSNSQIVFDAQDELGVYNGATVILETNRVFRDTSAFYHIVVTLDATQSGTDKAKLYVNGVQETSFKTDGRSSFSSLAKANQSGEVQDIGSDGTGNFLGLMTHVHMTDNYAYPASTFGETDSTSGIWKPKTLPSVTYGTNGFFLKFENSGNLDLDSSGNNLTFATTGTLTQNVDTPTNNCTTLNAIANTQTATVLTNGNTTHTDTGGSWLGAYSSLGANAGKWYAEGKITDRMNYSFGVIQNGGDSVANINTANNNLIGRWNDGWGFNGNNGSTNKKYHNNSTTDPYGEVFADNDIFMIAVDVTGGKIYFGRNGTWFDSGNPATGANPAFTGETFTDSVHFASGMESGSLSWNFGSGYFGTSAVASANADANGHGQFEYAVPSGFYTLNTKNIKEFG